MNNSINQINILQAENQYLRGLVEELIPFMIIDVQSGIDLGPPLKTHNDWCDDCLWYNTSKWWEKRILTGEFDEYAKDLSQRWNKE